MQTIHRKRVGFLPRDVRAPRRRTTLLGQWLRNGQQQETDVENSDKRRQRYHQVVTVRTAEVRTDGRACHQARCKWCWDL